MQLLLAANYILAIQLDFLKFGTCNFIKYFYFKKD